MIEKNFQEEKWMIYRKSDQHLPEHIVNQDHDIICFISERKYQDSEFEEEEINQIEFRSKLIAKAPEMYDLLIDIHECLSAENEIQLYKNKIIEIVKYINDKE
jgi:hypothetical protein